MKNLYLIGLLVSAMILTSCGGPPPVPTGREDDRGRDYEKEARQDEDRDQVLRDSRERYKGRACEDEDRDHDCRDQCREIYSKRGFRDDCQELSVSQIEKLNELHELLEDPDEDSLADVDFKDWDVYLNISIEPLDKLVKKYSRREAREFILWLIGEDEEIFKVFQKEDKDFDTLTSLLKGFSQNSFSGNSLVAGKEHEPFVEKIEGSDKLMELAVNSRNEEVVKWLMEYINEKVGVCEREETSKACFQIYCKIGDGIDEDSQDEWLSDHEEFEDYIEDIIDEGTNKNTASETEPYYWGSSAGATIEDVGDLENWVDDLCKPTGGNNLITGNVSGGGGGGTPTPTPSR